MNRKQLMRWLVAGAAALALLAPQTTVAKGKGGPAKAKRPGLAGKLKPDKVKGPKGKLDKAAKKELKLDKKADKAAAKLDKKADKAADKLDKKADKAADKMEKAADKADAKLAKKAGLDSDKPGRRLALGKEKNLERRKHLERLAKIERLKEIAGKTKNDKLQTRANLLQGKEMTRHQKALARLAGTLDAKAAE